MNKRNDNLLGLLVRVKAYIEHAEEELDCSSGVGYSAEKLISTGNMPRIYLDVLEAISLAKPQKQS